MWLCEGGWRESDRERERGGGREKGWDGAREGEEKGGERERQYGQMKLNVFNRTEWRALL